MKGNAPLAVIVLLSIVFIALFGGSKGVTENNQTGSNGIFTPKNTSTKPLTEKQKQALIAKEIREVEKEVKELKKKVEEEIKKKTHSEYNEIIKLSSVIKNKDPKKEYLKITVGNLKAPVNVTGWTVKSLSSGVSVTIPKSTYLFFVNSPNSEQDIYLESKDVMYLTTGISPNGSSFKKNKCSGYLSQFQTFTPSLGTSCPRPRDEDLSSIPKTVNNDDCLEYIERFPSCRTQTKSTPANWSYECTNFIYTKINYSSCVDTHKNDADFYKNEWRVYLKRSERLWKDRREVIVLYDSLGKIVDTLEY